MSGESAPKPRLVLCPKCWQLLPEPSGVDVYKCGGCGTTLKAKKRKNGAVTSGSSTRVTDAASSRNALDLVSDDKQHGNGEQLVSPQENSFREKATSPSSGERSLDVNGERDQIENDECNGEQQVTSQDNGLRGKASSSSSGECSLKGNGGSDHIENGECNEEQLGPFNLSDEGLENKMYIHKLSDIRQHRVSDEGCSNERTHGEIEASTELKEDSSIGNANNTKLQLEGEELSNGDKPLEGAGEELICALDNQDANTEKSALVGLKSELDITGSDLGGVEKSNNGNLPVTGSEQELILASDGEEVKIDKSAIVVANHEVEISGSNKAEAEELQNGKLLLKGAEEEFHTCTLEGEDTKNDQSALVGANSEVDIAGSASAARKSSTENFVSEMGSISHVSPCKLEEGTSENHASSTNEQQKQAQKIVQHRFDRVRSVDTFDASEVINPSSDLSVTLGEMARSTTTRSYHAYDGSISSNDGLDERFSSQQLVSFDNTYNVANGVSTRKGKGLVNSMLHGDLETQQQSYLSNGKQLVPQDSRGNQNKELESERHGHPYWMRTKRDEFPSKMSFHRSGSQSGYESGSQSNQTYDELYCSSSYSFEDPDQEKMKLLRMVYKLQDQLNRTSYVNSETNGRLSTDVSYKGKHVSPYHSHDLHEGRFYHGLNYPRCDRRCGHGINWHQRHSFSQSYVSEVSSCTHHVGHSCFHCYPQELQSSAELPPPHFLFQHEEICRSLPGHNYCSSHSSYPSSPQCFVASKVPVYGHETKSGDQMHRALEVKKYLREKNNLTKRHYRPVAGGAPFVTCYKCLKLLHLPADFLLFKRVFHQLKCGTCSEVLKFSLQNRSHIVSYAPNAITNPLSSELDDQNVVTNGNNMHSESHADPIPYSDGYGHSVSKSYSSEGDPVSLTPSHALHGSESNVSHRPFEPIPDEKVASRDPSTSKVPVETDELAVHSSNMSGSEKLSSEIEAQSQPKSSPLHQLMGYSSPSQVIRGIQFSIEGKEPIPNGENDLGHSSLQK